MRIRPLSRDEVRSIDARAVEIGLPSIALMENAGRGAADWLDRAMDPGSTILVACGPGNNGGDGAVLARHLDARGHRVIVASFADPEKLTGDAAIQHKILRNAGIPLQFPDTSALDLLFSSADWVVDALLGTGLTRPVSGQLLDVISAFNRSARPVLSLDLPSGLDADTGQPLGISVRATSTVTFVAPKLGFSLAGASEYTGSVHIVEIGVPRRLLEAFQGPLNG